LERQFSSAEPTHKKKPPWPYEGSVPLGQAQEHLLLSLTPSRQTRLVANAF
jgi:hypothetical protein